MDACKCSWHRTRVNAAGVLSCVRAAAAVKRLRWIAFRSAFLFDLVGPHAFICGLTLLFQCIWFGIKIVFMHFSNFEREHEHLLAIAIAKCTEKDSESQIHYLRLRAHLTVVTNFRSRLFLTLMLFPTNIIPKPAISP